MKQRSRSLPALVVAAVLALVLGSFGTAVAGPALTKAQVRSIATKVVKRLAPTLSVARAANAANAAKLNGLPGSAYRTRAYTYALPTQAAVNSRNYTFPGLPAGTYQVNSSVVMSTTGINTAAACYFQQVPPSSTTIGLSYAGFNGIYSQITGTGVVQQTPTLTMNCNAATNFTIAAGTVESAVTFTAIDTRTVASPVGTKGDAVSMGAASAQ